MLVSTPPIPAAKPGDNQARKELASGRVGLTRTVLPPTIGGATGQTLLEIV